MTLASTIATPAGPLSVLVDDGTVVAAGFTTPQALWERLDHGADDVLALTDDLGSIGELVEEYLAGRLDALDEIPVAQPGTDLQQEIWSGLRAIPAGQTRTYTELAATTSRPRAVRAAGTACGRNLIAPMIPCHRALRSDGSLGGYYYGLEVKRWLLDHEARHSGGPT
jgi:methylated-DNA-[protein]-cysteine S-methyltransferase